MTEQNTQEQVNVDVSTLTIDEVLDYLQITMTANFETEEDLIRAIISGITLSRDYLIYLKEQNNEQQATT